MGATVASGPVPELPEVEAYRRLAEEALHRPIAAVDLPDLRYIRGGTTPRALRRVLKGASFSVARRIGKLLVLDLEGTPMSANHRLGVRFGMTGSLFVDGHSAVDELIYSSKSRGAQWDRFGVRFGRRGRPRRPRPPASRRCLDRPRRESPRSRRPTLTPAELRQALAGSSAPLKARLMDQARIAGIGNLLADEILWRASLAPTRRAGSLSPAETRRLHHHLRTTLDRTLGPGRLPHGRSDGGPGARGSLPADGAPLMRSTVGGRTTYWCPRHQK